MKQRRVAVTLGAVAAFGLGARSPSGEQAALITSNAPSATASASTTAPPAPHERPRPNPPPQNPQPPAPPPPANSEACAASESALRTFLAQYFATVFTLVGRDQGGEDAPTEQEVEDSVADLIAAAHTLRSALSQIANQAPEPLK